MSELDTNAIIEKRSCPRIAVEHPISITEDVAGETTNLSETGVCFTLKEPISQKDLFANLNVDSGSLKVRLHIIWDKLLIEENKFLYGASFLGIESNQRSILREALIGATSKEIIKDLDDNENKREIDHFFANDVRLYLEKLIELTTKINSKRILQEEARKTFFFITDTMMRKAEELGMVVKQRLVLKRVKQVFRELVGSWAYKSHIVKRAYDKPRGYPGDYQMLETIYNNQTLSKGIGLCFDHYFLNNEYAVAVRNRKDKILELLLDFVKNSHLSKINILNIACGSCRELKELFSNSDFTYGKEINFTLVDQDEEALDFSRNLFKKISLNIKSHFLCHNVLQLVRNKDLYKKRLGKYDFIYSVGLADYLPDRVLRKFIQFCFEILNVGGKLVLAHKDIEQYRPLPPNWFCDWNFYPRTKNDLSQMVKSVAITDKPNFEFIREKSQLVLFLILKK